MVAEPTRLGTVATPLRASVDERGLVTTAAGWSLDWWIGAEDRWHRAAVETTVRQRLVDDAPVVETAMRVPGGDAVHRAYAVRSSGAAGGSSSGTDVVVVEIANETPVPFAVALVVRGAPAIELSARTLSVGGRSAVWLPRPPNLATATDAGDDALIAVVTSGAATDSGFMPVTSPDHRAAAALLFPLPHTAVVRVALPLGVTTDSAPEAPDWPSADAVARGWRLQVDRGMKVDLPDETLMHTIASDRAQLLLRVGGDGLAQDPATGAVPTWAAAVASLGTLDAWGYHDEVAAVLARLGQPGVAVDGAALVAMADHWRLTRDRAWVQGRTEAVLAGVQACGSRWRGRGRGRRDPWRGPGLAAAAELLAAVDQPEAAARVARRAEQVTPGPGLPTATEPLQRVRDDLVHERDGGAPHVVLGAGLAPAWRGQSLDVRDAPTAHGVVSYAVRWHGERPALLWEVADAAAGLTLSAPALDATWTTTEAHGDALLSGRGDAGASGGQSSGHPALERGASFS